MSDAPDENGPAKAMKPWDRGGPTPNPRGRPKNYRKSLFAQLDPFAAEFLEHDGKIIGEINGESVTTGEAILRIMARQAQKDPSLLRSYMDIRERSLGKKATIQTEMLAAAVDYKERYTGQFANAEKLGRRPPNIYPHPSDVILDPDGGVRVVGPIDKEQADLLDEGVNLQGMLLEAATNLAEAAIAEDLSPEAIAWWKYLQRKFYKLNAVVPPRLRRKFPSYRPGKTSATS